MKLNLKEIVRCNSYQDGPCFVRLNDYDSPQNYIDKAVVQSASSKKLFKGPQIWGKLKVLKITNPQNGRSVWREISTYGIQGVTKEDIAMTYNSLWELGFMDKKCHEVEVEQGCLLMYYWKHPVNATRMSFIVGFLALAIGLISLIVGLITLIN